MGGRKTLDVSLLLYITGCAQVTRWVSQYGIKVSSWGSETFKIVIPVENHPQKPKKRLHSVSCACGVPVVPRNGEVEVVTTIRSVKDERTIMWASCRFAYDVRLASHLSSTFCRAAACSGLVLAL